MNDLERLTGLMNWAAKSVNNNLDFVPDDKLNWKPAPGAKDALDIAHEIAMHVDSLSNLFVTGEWQQNVQRAETRDEAKAAITAAAQTYTKVLQSMTPEKLAENVALPWGEAPIDEAIAMPLVELLHHHGQIVYIQTLLGDTENHTAH